MIAHKQHIVKKDFTVEYLKHKFSSGQYAVNPLYQRDDSAWDYNKKQAFISDVILNPLVVPIHLDGRDTSKTYILDGQQRLTTFKQFINNEFVLKKDTKPAILQFFEDFC